MTRQPVIFIAVLCAAVLCASDGGLAASQDSITLATTTSTQDSGLLDMLVPRFEKGSGIAVKVIAIGTGAALRMASTGDADVVLVHAPEEEKKYVAAGDLSEGRRVMHNDFVIVGPPEDPAGVGQQKSIEGAMCTIAERGLFISRGDNSGTHIQELSLWASARIGPQVNSRCEETGQGMGATLNVADQKRAYALTDRGTYLSARDRLGLTILFQGHASLYNVYHVYLVNPDKHKQVRAEAARAFIEFILSPVIQRAIGDFKREEYGEPLFFPDALPSGGDQVASERTSEPKLHQPRLIGDALVVLENLGHPGLR